MLLVKLGGSVVTNKNKALTPRRAALDRMADALSRIDEPLVVVHGGGSFGHYWSVKYGMHTEPARYGRDGVAAVKNSMVQLDLVVLEALHGAGMAPYAVPPAVFVGETGAPVRSRAKEVGRIARSGMVPVTYGDALLHGGGGDSYILSGDRVMGMLAAALRPRLSVFATNVDGLYSGDVEDGELIGEYVPGSSAAGASRAPDVTGGMARKVGEAERMARAGLDVFFVNGNRPRRITDAASGAAFRGTMFRGA